MARWRSIGEVCSGIVDDRIEALVKERDEVLEWLSASQGYIADAVYALDKQEKAEARAEQLEAALRGLMMHEPDHPDTLWQEARAALEPVAAPDLTDPVTVHANMMRGTIAKPTIDQIIHLYGVDALVAALAPVIVREAALDDLARLGQEYDAAPDPAPHVNKTLKSEHDADNTLTDPAAIREAALREALAEFDTPVVRDVSEAFDYPQVMTRKRTLNEVRDAILALIPKGADHE